MENQPLAFWNVERLFDADSHIRAALEGLQPSASDPASVDRKVAVLAAVVREFAGLHGPPCLLGLAEIESVTLIDKFIASTGLNLEAIEGKIPDELGLVLDGLDITLLYDPSRFGVPSYVRSHVLDRTFDTRDVLEVELPCLATGQRITVLVNHWPSRLSLESADRRVSAAYFVRRLVLERLRYQPKELWDANAQRLRFPVTADLLERARQPLVLMGDFNDQPYDRSIEILDTTAEVSEVVDDLQVKGRTDRQRYSSYLASNPRLLNPFWHMSSGDIGSFYRSPRWRVYDQIMFARGAVELFGARKPVAYALPTVTIDGSKRVLMTRQGRPLPFEDQSNRGASDHLLVSLVQ